MIVLFVLFDSARTQFGFFFGRFAYFFNGELVGKVSDVYWSVIFPKIDPNPRHPSQIYEAILEGLFLFIILNIIINKKKTIIIKYLNCSKFIFNAIYNRSTI